MPTTDMPAFSWVCPECGRRVPRTLRQCRCGRGQDGLSPAVEARPQGVTSPGPSGFGKWSGWIAAVALACVSLLWMTTRRAPTPHAPAGTAVLHIWHPYLKAPGNEIVLQVVLPQGASRQSATLDLRMPPMAHMGY